MRGITFFQLISPFGEDITKNCGLTGVEMDQNFLNLKLEDVKTVYWAPVDKTLVLERKDDSKIEIKGILDDLKDFDFEYDPTTGILHIGAPDGKTFDLEGFVTKDMINQNIYGDNTINGNGTIAHPLSISSLFRTGMYKPAMEFFDITQGQRLPSTTNLPVGSRYVTKEKISDFGLLYNFTGVAQIASDLLQHNCEWRIPSKGDWDGILNQIEPCETDRNHDSATSNRNLGRFAGKLLKSNDMWKLEDSSCPPIFPVPPVPPCDEPINPTPNRGTDLYGFRVLPSGWSDGGNVMADFKERGVFWTSTVIRNTDIFTKRFDYDRSTVFQETVGPNMLLSLRLVKDFNGNNFNERESIGGQNYSCVLMADVDGTSKIWIQTNIALPDERYCGVEPNHGQGITSPNRFFINEWSGREWLRTELSEGESIVIFNGSDGHTYSEYRVIRHELVNIDGSIKDLAVKVGELEDKIIDEINRVDDRIDQEIERATDEEDRLDNKIIDLSVTVTTQVTRLDKKIDDLDIEINERIDDEVATLNDTIITETERALAEEERLDKKIDDLSDTIDGEIVRLDDKIDVETQNRIDNDINSNVTYTMKVDGGMELLTNNNTPIVIEFDGSFGAY